MFAREVRAPADLVFGIPGESPPNSYDDYSVEMEARMKQAYILVRQHLGRTAERMKRQYDLRVRPQKFRRGQWVLYYNPCRIQGRQQKWQRKFSPYLVVKELPPVNYLVQKSKRSRPFVAHVDKLKVWHTDDPPKSWLTDDDQPFEEDNSTPLVHANMNESELADCDEGIINPAAHRPTNPSSTAKFCDDQTAVKQVERVEPAIAGDPTSTLQPMDRPRRQIRIPVRYRLNV